MEPDSLVTQAARALAPRLTSDDLPVLPVDLYEVLQRYMGRGKQIELFSDYKYYHDNGQLCWHWHYKDGKKHGESKRYYESGQLMWHTHYKDGKKYGESKAYYEDGQLKWHYHYKDGKKHGKGKEYYKSGKLWWHRYYKDGVCIKD